MTCENTADILKRWFGYQDKPVDVMAFYNYCTTFHTFFYQENHQSKQQRFIFPKATFLPVLDAQKQSIGHKYKMCLKVMLIPEGVCLFFYVCFIDKNSIKIWKISSTNLPKHFFCFLHIINYSTYIHYFTQLLQTLTGWSQPRSFTGRRFGEQMSQTPWPHDRQWCRVNLGPKAFSQTLQLFINSSGIQYDGRVVSFKNSENIIWFFNKDYFAAILYN